MNYNYILAIDPSGAFDEGKGTTGWSLIKATPSGIHVLDVGYIDATEFDCAAAYWNEHTLLIDQAFDTYRYELMVVIEDYLLYAEKSKAQINSRMETSKVIGIMQHHCWCIDQPYFMQPAGAVVNRWNDEILVFKKIIEPARKKEFILPGTQIFLNRHIRDSLRHGVHYATFKNKGGYYPKKGNKK